MNLTRYCGLQGWYSRLCSPTSWTSLDLAQRSKSWPLSAYYSYSLPLLSSDLERPAQPAGLTSLNPSVPFGRTLPIGGSWLESSSVSGGEKGNPIPPGEGALTINQYVNRLWSPFFFISEFAIYRGFPTDLSFYMLSILNASSMLGRLVLFTADKVGR